MDEELRHVQSLYYRWPVEAST